MQALCLLDQVLLPDSLRPRDDPFVEPCIATLVTADEKHGIVTKRTLKGEEVWTMGYPQDSPIYQKGPGSTGPGGAAGLNYRPTNLAIAPNGDFFVADGQGGACGRGGTDAYRRDLKGAGQMRKLHEMDESSGDITVDPIETEGGDLSNQDELSPQGD